MSTLLAAYLLATSFFFHKVREDGLCEGLEIVVKDSLEKPFVTPSDLTYMLKKAQLYPVEKPMNEINTEKIEQELLNNNMISSIKVYKTPSRKIKLEIEQKMPILRVNNDYYVDEEGNEMPLTRHYASSLNEETRESTLKRLEKLRIMVATGNIEKEFAKSDLYNFVLFLQKDHFWNDQIVQIYVNADHDVELVPLVGNQRILLGSLDDYPEKLEKLRLFYDQAIPKVGWEKYSMINLKYKNQIVCTKR